MHTRRRRRWTGLLAGAALVGGVVTLSGPAGSAEAKRPDPCSDIATWCESGAHSNLPAKPDDSGGADGRAGISIKTGRGTYLGGYEARFDAYDEILWIVDDFTDDRGLIVEARYVIGNRTYVERLNSRTSYRVELGPGGDIPENTTIRFTVWLEDSSYRLLTFKGTS